MTGTSAVRAWSLCAALVLPSCRCKSTDRVAPDPAPEIVPARPMQLWFGRIIDPVAATVVSTLTNEPVVREATNGVHGFVLDAAGIVHAVDLSNGTLRFRTELALEEGAPRALLACGPRAVVVMGPRIQIVGPSKVQTIDAGSEIEQAVARESDVIVFRKGAPALEQIDLSTGEIRPFADITVHGHLEVSTDRKTVCVVHGRELLCQGATLTRKVLAVPADQSLFRIDPRHALFTNWSSEWLGSGPATGSTLVSLPDGQLIGRSPSGALGVVVNERGAPVAFVDLLTRGPRLVELDGRSRFRTDCPGGPCVRTGRHVARGDELPLSGVGVAVGEVVVLATSRDDDGRVRVIAHERQGGALRWSAFIDPSADWHKDISEVRVDAFRNSVAVRTLESKSASFRLYDARSGSLRLALDTPRANRVRAP